jgi:hypothetical protein
MKSELTGGEKWRLFLTGQDVGPMVSPLCDDWTIDMPYRWPFDEPDPFPPGHPDEILSQQMAMAGVCGWDATFLCGGGFIPARPEARPQTQVTPIPGGGSRVGTRYTTPYGDLTSVTESKTSMHTVKRLIETEEDLRRMTWVVRAEEYNADEIIADGWRRKKALRGRGVMGTWYGTPIGNGLPSDETMFYLAVDYPEAFEELAAASFDLAWKQLDLLAKAGFDYLFYCVNGTEWGSPDFFRERMLERTRRLQNRWRELGGFVLWHSCGHVKAYVELGFFNDLMPEILETLSEPPVGTVPSLRWARERLDRRIATKGNMPLNILLQGTPDDVRADVRRIRSQTAGYRHIVGLSDDLLKNTPLANALAFVDEARKP